jgi:hypothetical protein
MHGSSRIHTNDSRDSLKYSYMYRYYISLQAHVDDISLPSPSMVTKFEFTKKILSIQYSIKVVFFHQSLSFATSILIFYT